MCIFCSIVNKEIPCQKVYEDENVLAFLDINPTAVGHTLVIPKTHYESFLDCPKEVRDQVFEVANKIANKMMETLGCDGINLLSNMKEAAGQSVHHFHVHLIPRYENKDAVVIEFKEIDPVDFEDLKQKLAF